MEVTDTANLLASKTATQVLSSLTAQRSATRGVSLDEEMANMLRFQRGYQAAARALTAMDQNLEILTELEAGRAQEASIMLEAYLLRAERLILGAYARVTK
mgnify:CR=1 FL=1